LQLNLKNRYVGSMGERSGRELVFFGVPVVSVRLFGDLSSVRAVLNKPKASSAGIAIVVGSDAIDLFPPAYDGGEVFLHRGGGIK
jgi:hypothetical protein